MCIIIGYSFRDEDITKKIIESIKSNKKLWIILISPNGDQLIQILKRDLNSEQNLRIIHKNKKIEVLADVYLSVFLEELRQNISREESLWKKVMPYSLNQLKSSDYFESEWSTTLIKYKELGLKERANHIVKELSNLNKISSERLSLLSDAVHSK